MLANIAGRDAGSVTGSNLNNLEEEFGLDPWTSSSSQLAAKYSCYAVPAADGWRLPLLVRLLDQRKDMETMNEKTKTISELIDSLCYS